MNATLEFISHSAARLCREQLAHDEGYCRLKRECGELWARFRSQQSDDMCARVLELRDADCLVLSTEADALFLLGLQMGLELNALDGFPGE